MDRFALVNGVGMRLEAATIPITDPGFTRGWSVFETLRSREGRIAHVERHLERLAASCEQAYIRMPHPEQLKAELSAAVGVVPDARLRITLTGGGQRIVTAEPLDLARLHAPLTAVTRDWRPDPFVGGAMKHGSRVSWLIAVERSGADEVLFVDEAGRFAEGTTSAILAVIDGTIYTAPHDGQILPSVTCTTIVERAEELGIPVVREGAMADASLDALYVASTTRHLAPVVELNGVTLPGWESVGRQLAALDG
ncbi:MAG: aminotransferase class IV [Proteobacteria bacterium]|nr:aminotransferase class IV [Pseudomonadota bacterium]